MPIRDKVWSCICCSSGFWWPCASARQPCCIEHLLNSSFSSQLLRRNPTMEVGGPLLKLNECQNADHSVVQQPRTGAVAHTVVLKLILRALLSSPPPPFMTLFFDALILDFLDKINCFFSFFL